MKEVKQDSDYCRKRWFRSSDMDLFAWLDHDNTLDCFQLCYDKFSDKRAFTWSVKGGYRHYIVAGCGESCGMAVSFSPECLEESEQQLFPKDRLVRLLSMHINLEKSLFNQVLDKINHCPFNQYWYLYMIRSSDNALYTGITTDVERRLEEHQSGNKGAKYFRGKTDLQLVFRYQFDSRSVASSYEAKVKKLSKSKKEMIVNGEIKLSELTSEMT